LHPFEGLREYTRALNAVKLERVFAKPVVGNLDGHQDGVSCLGKHPQHLSLLVSGSYDGEVCFITSEDNGVSVKKYFK
jgi:WD repeat and SOF domain-containing protein 1